MEYYRIFKSSDTLVIGTFPQVSKCIIPTTINDPKYIGNFFWEKLPENSLVPQCILDRKAKKTDLMSASSAGFSTRLLVSQKLHNVFQNFDHYGMQFLSTKLIDKNSVTDEYWIINPFYAAYECLDFVSSKFLYYTSSFLPPEKNVVFKDVSDFIKYQNKLPSGHFIQIDRVSFSNDVNKDFFAIKNVSGDGTGYYVSKRLKEKIEEIDCTGVVYKEPNEVYP